MTPETGKRCRRGSTMNVARWFSAPKAAFLVVLAVLLAAPAARAAAYVGYTIYGPNGGKNTYLINNSNTAVKSWTHAKAGGYSVYLLPDGSVIRNAQPTTCTSLNGGGAEGVVTRTSWAGSVTWEYTYCSTAYRSHHDIEPMPNGNVLLIAWEVKTATQAVAAGLNHSAEVWPDHIVEIQPSGTTGGTIVWQWHAWDHLVQHYDSSKSNYGVVADHPELLDINMDSNFSSGDWMHLNGISYNPDLDQIVVSSHQLNEVYVIDHSTTTAEAASHAGGRSGHGGDILYRWGQPSNYGAPGSQVFDVVHSAIWIPSGLPGAGHVMAFNNRESQSTSMVVELETPYNSSTGQYTWTPGTAYAPASPAWSYTATGFYSQHLGSTQRLPNGNTLICQSTSGYMFEVDPAGTTQWSYAKGGEIVRITKYAPDYAGLSGLWPTVTTPTAASIGTNTATLGANVTAAGYSAVTARGVVWSTSANPTLANGTVISTSGTTGVFTVSAVGRPAGTLVHYRGYATNSINTAYTADATFYTLSYEPSYHASGFTATAASTTSMGLNWTAGTGANGYLVLQRAGADPTGTPADATSYTVGATIGTGTVAVVVTGGSTAATISGLAGGISYHYANVAFDWDGTNAATINYKTDGTIPTATSATDYDGDGVTPVTDCNDLISAVWATPGEARSLLFAADKSRLSWTAPQALGATSAAYDVIRAASVAAFSSGTCVASNVGALDTTDGAVPDAGAAWYYLVRAENACPSGTGPLGYASSGSLIGGRSCP
jgi:hypothetical protein